MGDVARSATAFAKTTQPALGSVVAREALFARLEQPPGRVAIWISGPPGSGKTTLAASYLEARGFASIWYQVDADDADPAGFFHYLRHAARRLDGLRSADLPSFTLQHNDAVPAFARKLFRALFAKSRRPFALVLDNLHAVPGASVLHEIVQAAIGEVTRGSCIVVTSRIEPPAYLARLRAAGQVATITGGDLAMGPAEINAIAALRGQNISPDTAARLFERTQGWAAGLVLMIEHARFTGKIADLPGGAPPQVIFDYLAGEIFDRFERGTREFLLRIACLPRMTAAVAEKLSGESAAARMLVNLDANDYFVRSASVDGHRVYEVHPLLRDFLRSRAALALPEAATGAWLQRAAALLRQAGYAEDAITLLIEAGDWNQVAELVLESADAMLAQGRGELLVVWLDALPEGTVDGDPRLARVGAGARAHASPRAARRLYERAFEGFRATGDEAGMVQCCGGILRAVLIEFDDYGELDRWLRTFEQLTSNSGPATDRRVDAAAAMPWVRALLVRDPANARLGAWVERGMAAERPERTGTNVGGQRDEHALLRAMTELARGNLVASRARLEALRSSTARRSTVGLLAMAIAAGLHQLVGGRHRDAERVAQDALEAAEAEGIHAYDAWLHAIVAAARLQGGDRTGAREALQRMEAPGSRLRRGDRACIHYLQGWLAALEQDSVRAYQEARVALAVAIEVGLPWLEGLARLAVAQTQSATGDRRGAEVQIRSAGSIATHLASPWLECGTRLAEAGAACADGDRNAVLEGLESAFRLCREHGFMPPPQWQPELLATLCERALDAEVEPEFARTLVRDAHVEPRVPPLRVKRWPWPIRIRTLGGFQLLREDAPVGFSGKGPGRPIELLKVLVALGGRDIRAEQLADALWPDAEADFAHQSFTATLHRLRRTLQADDALVLSDGRLTLERTMVWVDTWALDQSIEAFEGAMRNATPDRGPAVLREFADEVREVYRGPFLPDESEQPAYIACREQARSRILRLLARVARGFEEAGDPQAAMDCYLRFIEADEFHEPFHRHLMQGLQRRGDIAEAIATYERLRTLLAARTKTMPSPEAQALYAGLKATPPPATR